MVALLRCPRCLVIDGAQIVNTPRGWYSRCWDCGLQISELYDTDVLATEAWNTFAKKILAGEDFREELVESNSLLRSTYYIAARSGRETNWDAFLKQLETALTRQRMLRVKYSDIIPSVENTPT